MRRELGGFCTAAAGAPEVRDAGRSEAVVARGPGKAGGKRSPLYHPECVVFGESVVCEHTGPPAGGAEEGTPLVLRPERGKVSVERGLDQVVREHLVALSAFLVKSK